MDTTSEKTYHITGMDCAGCAETVQKGVSRLDGVQAVRVDFMTGKMRLQGEIDDTALKTRLGALGYGLDEHDGQQEEADADNRGVLGFVRYLLAERETQLALAGGTLLLLGVILALAGINAAPVYIAAMAVALYPIAKSGLRTLFINRDFNINLLMTIAACGALFIGEYWEAALVIFLFAIGEALEGYTAERARDSLRGLVALAPAKAIRLESDGSEAEVPVEALAVGDRILVKPGERIPMDGTVQTGQSGVDQATITGESLPVHKDPGDEVYAGTLNGDGALEIEVTQLAEDNTLSRIIQLVEEAQSVRAPSQRFIDQFARYYTPAVVVVAALVATIPPLVFGAPFYDTPGVHGWLYRALALLVIACPCALVISTPVTIISAITAAARRGVLIKGGAHLEALGGVNTIAFDKTGTLTQGEPVVTQVRSTACNVDPANQTDCPDCDDLLALASAVERRSTHPLAQAVVTAAESRGVGGTYAPAAGVESLSGRGVRGDVAGQTVTIGSHRYFDSHFPHQEQYCQQVEALESAGQTAMLVHDGQQVAGWIAVADRPRQDSRAVINQLRAMGLQTVMLTGDNAVVAEAVAAQVGVDDVRANLLPEDKVKAVQGLGDRVAMIGDGVNDTPALAAARVGVAMGGAGSAQALETADIALMADDLKQLPYAVRLARFSRRLIGQNIVLSIGIKLVFVLLALGGATALWVAILADVGMALAVALNGMRPLRLSSE